MRIVVFSFFSVWKIVYEKITFRFSKYLEKTIISIW